MKKDPKRGMAPLEQRLRWLMYDLCVDLGHCIPPADVDQIAKSERLDAKEFASAVLFAEGFVPEYEKHHFLNIEQRFRDRFGSSVSVEDFEAT